MYLRNPIILASGFLGISQAIFERIYDEGAGAVVSKSISRYPMEGYRNPTIVVLENKSLYQRSRAFQSRMRGIFRGN